MRPDTLIRTEGMQALSAKLGLVEAERFARLITRERFDYTAWQREHFNDMSLDELIEDADRVWKESHYNN